MANTPVLDLITLDTHNLKNIAIGDSSVYPTNWNITQPSLQVTPPGYSSVTLSFEPRGVQVYNAYTLGMCLESNECDMSSLPDGIYTFKYTITPANTYNVTKQFFRTAELETTLDEAFLKLEIMECDGKVKKQKKMVIDDIEIYLSGAVASANQCALKQATTLYNKARTLLEDFIANLDCNCY